MAAERKKHVEHMQSAKAALDSIRENHKDGLLEKEKLIDELMQEKLQLLSRCTGSPDRLLAGASGLPRVCERCGEEAR